MSVRTWLGEHQLATIVGLLAVILLAGLRLYLSGNKIHPPKQQYYFDLTTNQVYVAPTSFILPVDAPSGQYKGVKAIMLSCDGCKSNYIGWLETSKKTIPDASAATNGKPPERKVSPDDDWYAVPPTDEKTELKWFNVRSSMADQIVDSALGKCENGKPARVCHP